MINLAQRNKRASQNQQKNFPLIEQIFLYPTPNWQNSLIYTTKCFKLNDCSKKHAHAHAHAYLVYVVCSTVPPHA